MKTPLVLAALSALALGACSSSRDAAQTSSADLRAAAQVEAVAYAQSLDVRPDLLAGSWRLNDEFERDCFVELSAEAIDAVHRKAQSTRECSGLMTHVGAWFISRDGQEIRLYDSEGRVIAQLFRSEDQMYRGPLTLNDQQRVTATFRQV